MRGGGLRIVVVIALVGQLCVPLAAQDMGVTRANILDAMGALIAGSARALSRSFGEVLFGYCAASWEGEWMRLCERHNELLADLQRERRLAFEDIEFRYANEVPGAVRARCESDATGNVGGVDPTLASARRWTGRGAGRCATCARGFGLRSGGRTPCGGSCASATG